MAPSAHNSDVGTALALAVISMSRSPLLLLDGAFNVVAASDTFLQEFGLDQAAVRGRSLFGLGDGEWDMPRLHSLLTAIGSGDAEIDAYELEMAVPGKPVRCLRLNAQRVEFSDPMAVRLLVTIVDVTEAKAAEKLTKDLIQQKDVLLQEIQHRVANSLQIIASVLLQNARAVSDESRVHLTDAHNRVMSVAAMQKQLAVSRLDDVILKPYLTQLCGSIGASMIADHSLVRIEVSGDGSVVKPEISVSLGLIVTELVINALKHAFPDGRKGLVSVGYQSGVEGWTLFVSDDGIGMPSEEAEREPGLGTAIVQALAVQLSAVIEVAHLAPGTRVSIAQVKSAAAVPDRAALHAV